MSGILAPCIIGGDWNMSASEVGGSTFPANAQVSLVVPTAVTCRTARSCSTIDFFALSSAAMRSLKCVSADVA
eukprot:8674214-Pyramimonas_sp.AAC.1